MLTVSIALATFNGARFLPRQLESLAWQTRLPDELVVTDDCSTDDTVAQLRAFAARAPFPVRIHLNAEPLGFRANFEKAVNLASCDLIMFCDQDDIWRPEKVAVMAGVLEDRPDLLLAFHNGSVVDLAEQRTGTIFDGAEQQALLAQWPPPPWHFARGLLQIFRRELLRFDDLKPLSCEHFEQAPLAHDRWYMFLALAFGGVAFVDRELLMYRQHGANAFGADRQRGLFARIAHRLYLAPDSDALGAVAARSRAVVLDAVAMRVADERRPKAERLARLYRDYADRLDRRRRTYNGSSLARRAAALSRSIGSGDYRGIPWGFDPRSVARDLIAGVAQRARK